MKLVLFILFAVVVTDVYAENEVTERQSDLTTETTTLEDSPLTESPATEKEINNKTDNQSIATEDVKGILSTTVPSNDEQIDTDKTTDSLLTTNLPNALTLGTEALDEISSATDNSKNQVTEAVEGISSATLSSKDITGATEFLDEFEIATEKVTLSPKDVTGATELLDEFAITEGATLSSNDVTGATELLDEFGITTDGILNNVKDSPLLQLSSNGIPFVEIFEEGLPSDILPSAVTDSPSLQLFSSGIPFVEISLDGLPSVRVTLISVIISFAGSMPFTIPFEGHTSIQISLDGDYPSLLVSLEHLPWVEVTWGGHETERAFLEGLPINTESLENMAGVTEGLVTEIELLDEQASLDGPEEAPTDIKIATGLSQELLIRSPELFHVVIKSIKTMLESTMSSFSKKSKFMLSAVFKNILNVQNKIVPPKNKVSRKELETQVKSLRNPTLSTLISKILKLFKVNNSPALQLLPTRVSNATIKTNAFTKLLQTQLKSETVKFISILDVLGDYLVNAYSVRF
ncbi:uncharacterized protein LOC116339678 [Contarinia nasturtii]|uniref:uncharacterized protein LOC116339678 n=1 Tax=Contarinia nasturtii TaxID=265458 RepID=UPI0012D3CC4E|nr:uncharacterized protein LOC116339678 [Contarinia nasturtii]